MVMGGFEPPTSAL